MASTDVQDEATTAELDALFDELCTWGRWGDDDERGALNHQTAEHRAHAAGLVVDGTTLSLAHDLPVAPTVEAPVPAQHHMLTSGDALDAQGLPGYEACGDYIGTEVHGLGTTHVDALSHMFVRGRMYNDRPPSEVRSDGARRNTVMTLADGLVGRGVLLDVPAALGVDFLGPEVAVGVADLEAAEAAQGLRVGAGDLLVISTGRDARRAARGGQLNPFTEGLAGLAPGCLPWLADRQVSVLGGDGISDRMPFRSTPQWPFPIHQIGIVSIGLHLIDNMALDRLAAACAASGRWEFLLTVSSLRIPGGTGCPVNPVALL